MNYFSSRLKNLWFSGWFLIIQYPISEALAIDVIDPARVMAAQCSQCHAMEGNKNEGFDRLNGESFNEIYEELMEMRSSNKNKLMHRQAKGYSEEQIWALANYFSQQSNQSGAGSNDFSDDEDNESLRKTENNRSTEYSRKKGEKSRRQERDD